MKTLIAVMTCHQPGYEEKAAAQRATWAKDVKGADLVFFKGRPHQFRFGGPPADEVWLDCSDRYEDLNQKLPMMLLWALERGYDYLWKVDDDVYLRPERLLRIEPFDYCGAVAPFEFSPPSPANYFTVFASVRPKIIQACVGWVYGLSKRSMETLLYQPALHCYNNHEDLWVGQKLLDYDIKPVHLEGRIKKPCTHGVPNGWANQMPPHPSNEVIASCEYTPEQMVGIHKEFTMG